MNIHKSIATFCLAALTHGSASIVCAQDSTILVATVGGWHGGPTHPGEMYIEVFMVASNGRFEAPSRQEKLLSRAFVAHSRFVVADGPLAGRAITLADAEGPLPGIRKVEPDTTLFQLLSTGQLVVATSRALPTAARHSKSVTDQEVLDRVAKKLLGATGDAKDLKYRIHREDLVAFRPDSQRRSIVSATLESSSGENDIHIFFIYNLTRKKLEFQRKESGEEASRTETMAILDLDGGNPEVIIVRWYLDSAEYEVLGLQRGKWVSRFVTEYLALP